jgi:hypothetical protein
LHRPANYDRRLVVLILWQNGSRIMSRGGTRSGKFLGVLLTLVLIGMVTLAWLERATLLSWYNVYQLAHASDSNRETRAEEVGKLGDVAVSQLLDYLTRPDHAVCQNSRAGLQALMTHWGGLHDDHTTVLVGQLATSFSRFSASGQQHTLELVADWFRNEPLAVPASGLLLASARLLSSSGTVTEDQVQGAALDLCLVLMTHPQGSEILGPGRDLIRSCLQSTNASVRRRAILAALHPGMDLLEFLTGLLNDPSPEVRQAVLLAVGPPNRVVSDETLLPALRDPDVEVRRLCEQALKSRGLSPEHLALAKLLGDPEPLQRLKILNHLRWSQDIDHGIWLRRLSHDPAPCVRAAAARMMSQQTSIDLTDRIDEMAQTDPSPTVGYLASVYLKQARVSQSTDKSAP